jgi:hypothetical protein
MDVSVLCLALPAIAGETGRRVGTQNEPAPAAGDKAVPRSLEDCWFADLSASGLEDHVPGCHDEEHQDQLTPDCPVPKLATRLRGVTSRGSVFGADRGAALERRSDEERGCEEHQREPDPGLAESPLLIVEHHPDAEAEDEQRRRREHERADDTRRLETKARTPEASLPREMRSASALSASTLPSQIIAARMCRSMSHS